jgi:hypothetical protein
MVIRQPELPAQLASIQVTTLKEGSKHFWRCARVGWAVKDCKELLQNAIDQKATLFEKYMQNCSECWLLMVAEVKPSSFIHPNQDTIGHGYRSPFERTFFMDLAQERLYELRTVSG